ncbi:MAG TPA: hypothetical protein VEX36_11955 [Thermoleophilaceae bacterium]|nr:hypothetical protein [Thermoleophilaceae bacterium]
MIKTMKRSLVLAAAVAALSAFAVPSMASAANWGVVGSNHTLTASVGFILNSSMGSATAGCGVSLGAKVRTPASSTLDILNSTNLTCPGPTSPPLGGWLANCTMSGVASSLPWTATAVSTTNIQMYMNYTVTVSGGANCLPRGQTYTLSGTVSGAWSGNGSNQHSLVFQQAPGLSFVGYGLYASVVTSGTYRNTQQTLTLN